MYLKRCRVLQHQAQRENLLKLTSMRARTAVPYNYLLTKPFWMRLPPTDCCPTQAIIWEMFSGDPFDPHSAMIRGLREQQHAERGKAVLR